MSETLIYVMQLATGPIKIGISKKVNVRLNQIRAANPYDPFLVFSGPARRQDETQLLELLHADIITGEWVRDSTKTRSIIEKFLGLRLPWRVGISPEEYHRRVLRMRRAEIKSQQGPPKTKRQKSVRRRLADGSVQEYTYWYIGNVRVDENGEPIRGRGVRVTNLEVKQNGRLYFPNDKRTVENKQRLAFK